MVKYLRNIYLRGIRMNLKLRFFRSALCLLTALMLVGICVMEAYPVIAAGGDFEYKGKSYSRSEDVPRIYIEDAHGVNVRVFI